MAIKVVSEAIQLASSGQPDEALQLLQPLGLSPAQQGKIAAILQGIKDAQHTVCSILSETAHYPLLDLPPEDLLAILSGLSWKDISTCAQVCQGLYQAIQTETLCKEIYQREFQTYYPAQNPSLGFYHACKKGHTAQHNFLNGVYALRTFKMENSSVCSMGIFDGKVISGSNDNTITIWDLKTGERLKILRGHQGTVYSIAVFNGMVVSGSRDHTIKIWDLETGVCLNTLREHQNTVSSLAIFNEKVISGSWDTAIKIWDLKTGKCLNTLEGHQTEVHSLAVFDGKAVSSSLDSTINTWDLETGKCLRTFQGDQRGACALTIFNGKVVSGSWDHTVSGSWDHTVRIWDLESGACLYIFRGCLGASSLTAFDGKVILGSGNGMIQILDPETRECLNTFPGHQTTVSSVAVSNGKVISSSWDGTIKVWDFTAEHSVVFTELAKLLRGDEKEGTEAMERFYKMPAKAKNEIGQEQRQILEQDSAGVYNLAETALKLKAVAIQGYVKKHTNP
jgi:WD40 repeat protein